jgi:hypothetical protein
MTTRTTQPITIAATKATVSAVVPPAACGACQVTRAQKLPTA